MTRPLTCLTLICAAGAGLYLYQEKHRAQMVDREINRIVHATEQVRDRTGMMRAEWALLNEPDRLTTLAAQHLTLQTMTPGQFVQLADLGSHLPAVGAPSQPPAAIEPAAPGPVAPVAPVVPTAKNAVPNPAALPVGKPTALPLLSQTAPSTLLPPHPAGPLMVQAILPPKPAHPPLRMAAAKPPEPVYHPVYAPVMQAFASQTPVQPIHSPSVQQASAGFPSQPYGEAAPYVGSALGMSRTMMAAPVPLNSQQ